jgi:hypothetical protein
MSTDKKLHLLATHGGQFLVADDFRPNGGLGVVPYPPSVAPMATVEAHMAINQRKGRIIILPLSFARQQCERAGLAFHVSNVSIANKPEAEPAIGRLISDYSHPLMMFDGKKAIINKRVYTSICNPTAADVCQLHQNAIAVFPGEEVIAAGMQSHPPPPTQCSPWGLILHGVGRLGVGGDSNDGMVRLARLELPLAVGH